MRSIDVLCIVFLVLSVSSGALAGQAKLCGCKWIESNSYRKHDGKERKYGTRHICKNNYHAYRVTCPNEKVISGYRILDGVDKCNTISGFNATGYKDGYSMIIETKCCNICTN